MNDPRRVIRQLESLQAFLRSLAREADNYGLLWNGGASSSQIGDFQNRLLGKANNQAVIFSRILAQANLALAQLNETPIQNLAGVPNGSDLAQLLRGRAMMLGVTIFQIRASLPIDIDIDIVNIYSNKKNMEK